MSSCSPPQIALTSSILTSYNACAFGIIRSKHHTSLQRRNKRTKRLAKQIACLSASLIGEVRNLLKYLFLIPLAKILTCKNTKCMAFQCQVTSKATGSAFYMEVICTGSCKVGKGASPLVAGHFCSLGCLRSPIRNAESF